MKTIARVMMLAAGMLAPLALSAADKDRSYVVLEPSAARSQLPFSDAVQAGNTLYVAGTIGLDPKTLGDMKTAHVPDDAAEEAKLVMEAVKRTVEGPATRWMILSACRFSALTWLCTLPSTMSTAATSTGTSRHARSSASTNWCAARVSK
jgi:enamine deaminase RidA (YjgF/YER057c/UK114 family)